MRGWTIGAIGEFAVEIKTGSTPSTARPEFFAGAIPWFTPEDIGPIKHLVRSRRTITMAAVENGKAKLFDRSMLLVTCIGQIGRVGILQQPSSCNQQITAIKFCPEVDESFAYYWFIANQKQLVKRANQALVPILNNERLKEIMFCYPPLAEQQHIAVILDRADRLRRMRRYAQQMSETFLQAVFVRMFGDPGTNPKGWSLGTIDDVITFSQYGTSEKSNWAGKGYPVLGMGNITYEGNIDTTSLAYVELSEKEFKELRLKHGDIIFNRTNSTELVGKTALWNLPMNAVIASYLVRLRLTDGVLPQYFVALLNGIYFKRLFQERCKKAVGQSNISPTLLREFPVMVPPLALQQQFARMVQRFERLRAQQREAERQAEHLFQSLLHRAFTGGL